MPRTAHRVVDNEPLRERAAIVGAVRADGEHVGAATHEQHRLLSDMADELAAVRQFGESNSLRQIRADRLRPGLQPFRPPEFCIRRSRRALRSTLDVKQTA